MIEIKQLLNNEKDKAAFEDDVLKGLIATDRRKRHINLFFVDKVSQGKGIGKELMRVVINNNENSYITVNSSRYGVPIYEKLGFVKIEDEKEQDGLKFSPMKLVLKDEIK